MSRHASLFAGCRARPTDNQGVPAIVLMQFMVAIKREERGRSVSTWTSECGRQIAAAGRRGHMKFLSVVLNRRLPVEAISPNCSLWHNSPNVILRSGSHLP
jgi:hypothetical protein